MQQRDALPARPRDLKPQIPALLDHALPVADQPGLYPLGDQRMCQLAQLHPAPCLGYTIQPQVLPLHHAPVALRVLNIALAGRIVGVCQPVLGIDHAAEVIEG